MCGSSVGMTYASTPFPLSDFASNLRNSDSLSSELFELATILSSTVATFVLKLLLLWQGLGDLYTEKACKGRLINGKMPVRGGELGHAHTQCRRLRPVKAVFTLKAQRFD